MPEKGKVFTGARARILIDGVSVGYGTGCTSREDIAFEKVRPMGHVRVVENVPTTYDVTFSMEFVRVVGETLKSRNIFPSVGANDDEHLRNILTNGLLTIMIMDRIEDRVVALLEEAQCSMRGMNINGQSIVGENTDWVGTVLRDESEV